MKFFLILLVIFGFLLVFVGFRNSQNSGTPGVAVPSPTPPSVTINSVTFAVRLAVTPDEQRVGLGGVTNMEEDEGMLFLYDKPLYSSFWMRGMKIPLDIIFILDDKVVGVFENLPPAADEDVNPPTWGGNLLSNRVLEVNAGLAEKYDIKVGDKVIIKL
jgi:uncharacterized membrane protein (UPF0127 family)